MKQAEFIEIIEKMGIPYTVIEETKGVYCMSKTEYELKKKNPVKYRKLYIPYYRVSMFEDSPNFEGHDGLYVRDNGITGYKPLKIILRDLQEYRKEDKNRKLIFG